MRRKIQAEVRALLRANPDGLTCAEIMFMLQTQDNHVRDAVKAMPDVYIDRWVYPRTGPVAAVWCAVAVPEDCPRPEGKKPSSLRNASSEDRDRKREERKAKAEQEKERRANLRQLANLTVIRGSWPYAQPH